MITYDELNKMYEDAKKVGDIPNLAVTSLPKDPVEREQKLQLLAWIQAGCPTANARRAKGDQDG